LPDDDLNLDRGGGVHKGTRIDVMELRHLTAVECDRNLRPRIPRIVDRDGVGISGRLDDDVNIGEIVKAGRGIGQVFTDGYSVMALIRLGRIDLPREGIDRADRLGPAGPADGDEPAGGVKAIHPVPVDVSPPGKDGDVVALEAEHIPLGHVIDDVGRCGSALRVETVPILPVVIVHDRVVQVSGDGDHRVHAVSLDQNGIVIHVGENRPELLFRSRYPVFRVARCYPLDTERGAGTGGRRRGYR